MKSSIRIAAVDDHALFLEGLRRAFRGIGDIEIVAEGATAADASRITAETKPDILLLDIDIPGSGIVAAHKISSAFPMVKIIMLTGSCEDDHVGAALNAGARGYVLKGSTISEVQDSIRAVHSGRPYVTQELASRLLVQHAGIPHTFGRDADSILDHREQQVAVRVSAGLTYREIAEELGLSTSTVRDCLSTILHKCGVPTRIEEAAVLENHIEKSWH
jgi:DNA-binding NarL/FixJ family response regulator